MPFAGANSDQPTENDAETSSICMSARILYSRISFAKLAMLSL